MVLGKKSKNGRLCLAAAENVENQTPDLEKPVPSHQARGMSVGRGPIDLGGGTFSGWHNSGHSVNPSAIKLMLTKEKQTVTLETRASYSPKPARRLMKQPYNKPKPSPSYSAMPITPSPKSRLRSTRVS
jgi:hypothetical protein